MPLLNPEYLETVVSLELRTRLDSDTGTGSEKVDTVATGFLIGVPTRPTSPSEEKLEAIFLVTNRHVFENRKSMLCRFNKEEGSKRFKLDLVDASKKNLWFVHEDSKIDIAVVPIDADLLEEEGIKFKVFRPNIMAFTDIMKKLYISAGDGVYVLGFPMGLSGTIKKQVIVRGGIIARFDDEIISEKGAFLIDSTVFPGNSGGPVIFQPTIATIDLKKPAVRKAYLLGVVSKYITYEEVAISAQTKEPRVVFVENSGLSYVVPMDYVKEIVMKILRPDKEHEWE